MAEFRKGNESIRKTWEWKRKNEKNPSSAKWSGYKNEMQRDVVDFKCC